jgi:hypothetical protein
VCSRSCSRSAAHVSVRTWRTVRLVGADSPCGLEFIQFVACSCVFVVRSVETSVFGWEWCADRPSMHRGPSERCELPADRPRVGHGLSDFRGVHNGGFAHFFGPSAPDPRTIQVHMDRLPSHHRPSAPGLTDCLSHLLIELCFRVALSLGLFLGLVGPL